ncbi:hypothetical protein [Paenibacillus sp. FSL P4-0288]
MNDIIVLDDESLKEHVTKLRNNIISYENGLSRAGRFTRVEPVDMLNNCR